MTTPALRGFNEHQWRNFLRAGDVIVLVIPSTDATAIEALIVDLSTTDYMKAKRFHFREDRRSFIAAHAALAVLTRLFLGPERVWRLTYATDGKPFIDGGGDGPLHISLSHTRGLAAVAFSRSAPVGVDVEMLRVLPDRDRLAEQILSCRERRAFARAADPDRLFFTLWCRKEAVLKAHGTGIIGDLRDCCVVDRAFGNDQSLHDLALPHGYSGAVSVLSAARDCQVIFCPPQELPRDYQNDT